MCGIVGYLDTRGSVSVELVNLMAQKIALRGPDDFGGWVDKDAGVALGHRRLSIVDLTPEGHQPKESNSGRFVITFNGEIYNFAELKKELQDRGHTFRGSGDTEVMLAGFEEWGVEESLKKYVGMFSFGVWDRRRRCLILARDRMGEKPMYYGWSGGVFFFGSDLSPFKVHPAFKAEIHRDAITQLLRHGYIPAPHSIYKGIFKLPQACYLKIEEEDFVAPSKSFSEFTGDEAAIVPKRYWNLNEVAGPRPGFVGTETEALVRFEELLSDAIKLQMISDVPLGAFLSGGIDSSTIVALMQKHSSRPVRTFSIGFQEKQYNEAAHAKAVAAHLGTDHTELYITPKDMLDVVPLIPQIYSEPFGDSSQIPTYLVAKIARRGVTVSLSGDAGDELFCGYSRYIWAEKLWRYMNVAPSLVRRIASVGIRSISPNVWNKVIGAVQPVLPKSFSFSGPGYKMHRAAQYLSAKSQMDLYSQLFSIWDDPSKVVLQSHEPRTGHFDKTPWPHESNFIEHMMWLDAGTYLPDDILVKVDRAAMAVSLETRVPMLDHRVVEFAWSLPRSMRLRGDTSKWLLRQLLYKYVPQGLVDRPKMGFGAPINAWLRGPLRDWAEALLAESRLNAEGYFDSKIIRKKWSEHLSGARDWQYPLWHVLMFQGWLERNR